MSTPKGYPSNDKEDRSSAEHSTVEPIRAKQSALSTVAHVWCQKITDADIVEAGSTTSVINATAHAARRGDVIYIRTGALTGYEVKVLSVDTNSITLAEILPSAPAAAVEFDILRHKYPAIDDEGSIAVAVTPAPIAFVLDGVDVEVNEDTGTPANNRPLPVKLTGVTGDINITANDLNISMNHANDSTKVGDGTDFLAIRADGSIDVHVASSALPTGASTLAEQQTQTGHLSTLAGVDFATEAKQDTGNTSLGSIDTKLSSQATAAHQVTAQTSLTSIDGRIATSNTNLGLILTESTLSNGALAALLTELQLKADLTETQPVSGPLTNTELRASAVPVTVSAPAAGTITQDDIAVGLTAVRLTVSGAPNAARKRLRFQPDSTSAARFFYGSSGVTTLTGIEIFPAQSEEMLNDASDYYIISDTAAQVVRVMEVV